MIVKDEHDKCDKEEKIYMQENISKTGQLSGRKKNRIPPNTTKQRKAAMSGAQNPEYSINPLVLEMDF